MNVQSKNTKSQAKANRKPAVAKPETEDWLRPISESAPCGSNLEYDHDYIMLFSKATTRHEVQYGTFVESPEPVNWLELEHECKRLMQRTKDIRVAVLYTRCRTRRDGAKGLAQGLRLLSEWLLTFSHGLHPHAESNEEQAEILEMWVNTLQALTDPEGLLADVRQIVLTKSALARLQVRDVERAFTVPRLMDALAPDSVKLQLRELHLEQPAVINSFAAARSSLECIAAWCLEQLGDVQPDFSPLQCLMQQLCPGEGANEPVHAVWGSVPSAHRSEGPPGDDDQSVSKAPASAGLPADSSEAPLPIRGTGLTRDVALAQIRAARQWFDAHEPSSPVPVLLRRAESLVGRRYVDIVRAIPAELLEEWSAEGPD